MKLKSIFYSFLIASLTSTAYAQVKIGSNPGTIGSNSNLEVEATDGTKTVIQKSNGNVGVGNASPSNKLHVTATSDPARLEGLQLGTGGESVMVVDTNGVLKKISTSIPVVTTRLTARLDAGYDASNKGSFVTVPIANIVSTDGNFSTTTYTYTVASTALYQVGGTFSFNSLNNGGQVSIELYVTVNQTNILIANINGNNYPNFASGLVVAGTLFTYLKAGDKVSLLVRTCGGCSGSYVATTDYTALAITKLN